MAARELRRVGHRLRSLLRGVLWRVTPRRYWLRVAARHRWVFVMGCNRSGKTTLANLLGAHPLVTVVGNGNSRTRALPSSESEGCPHIWTEKLSRFRLIETDDRRPAARLAFDWLHCHPRPRSVVVVESDLPAIQMRWLQTVFREVCFIGVARNGYAVAEGLRLKEQYAIDRCARQWNTVNRVMLDDARVIRKFTLVKYEEFVADPVKIAEAVARFIGIDPTPVRSVALNGWRLGNTDTRPSTLRDANGELIGRLSPADIDAITASAGEMLEVLGYGRPSLPGGGSHGRA